MPATTKVRVWPRHGVRSILPLTSGGLAWWLFGFSTLHGQLVSATFRRSFGRVTRVDYTWTRTDGKRFVVRDLYPWSDPFEEGDPNTECQAIPPDRWEDRNGDGRWDTWMHRVGPFVEPSGIEHCLVELSMDTLGTGRPDWQFVGDYCDVGRTTAAARQRRGF